jgi:1,4-dihydroxy-2-naphthoate octaprenyltransferase
MRDRENDKASGKNTLVVKLGIKKAKVYHTIILLLAVISAIVFTALNYFSPFQFIYLISLFPILLNLRTVWQHLNPQTLDPELKKIGLTTLVFSITFGLGLIIDHA